MHLRLIQPTKRRVQQWPKNDVSVVGRGRLTLIHRSFTGLPVLLPSIRPRTAHRVLGYTAVSIGRNLEVRLSADAS